MIIWNIIPLKLVIKTEFFIELFGFEGFYLKLYQQLFKMLDHL